jgi:hypothetical protein
MDSRFEVRIIWPKTGPNRTSATLVAHHESASEKENRTVHEIRRSYLAAIREIADGRRRRERRQAKVSPACRRMCRHTSKDSPLAGHVCENYESREGTRVFARDRKCYIGLVVELYGRLMIHSAACASSPSGVANIPVRGSPQRLVRSQRTQNQRGSWDRYSSGVDGT